MPVTDGLSSQDRVDCPVFTDFFRNPRLGEKNSNMMRPPAGTRTLKRAGMRLFGVLAKALLGASGYLALE